MLRKWRETLALTGIFLFAIPAGAQQARPSFDPRTEEALNRGTHANAAGKYEDAIKAFKEANKFQHNACFECFQGLVFSYTAIGDPRGAEESANKALEAATDASQRAAAHTLKASVLVSFAAKDAKRLATAENEFRQALFENKDELDARFGLGVVLLKEKRDEEGTRELQTYLSLAPTGPDAAQAKQFIADPRRARERFAPEFEIATLQGQKLSLSQFAGKIVVLDFWATWCVPCRESLPELKNLLKKYPREKLVLLSISADENEKAWRDFIAQKAMDWPQYLDSDERIQKMFHVGGYPTYIVIDGDGIIQEQIVGLNPQQSVAYRLRDALKSMKQLN